MNISTKAIVSNSEMIKNYKSCREKAEIFGKIFVLKNNQPDEYCFLFLNMRGFQYLSSIWKVLREKILQNLLILYQKKGKEKITPLTI